MTLYFIDENFENRFEPLEFQDMLLWKGQAPVWKGINATEFKKMFIIPYLKDKQSILVKTHEVRLMLFDGELNDRNCNYLTRGDEIPFETNVYFFFYKRFTYALASRINLVLFYLCKMLVEHLGSVNKYLFIQSIVSFIEN